MLVNIRPGTNNKDLQMLVTTDGGSTWGVTGTTTYYEAEHGENGSGGALNYNATYQTSNSTAAKNLGHGLGHGTEEGGSGMVHFFTPSNTTFIKHYYSTFQQQYVGDGSATRFTAGAWETSSAINGVQFKFDSGQINGYIAMFGVA